jgi:hypothetical protein
MNRHSIWKGFQWVAEVGKMGFRWLVGNGKQVRFWEDNWLGSCNLVIMLWEVLCDCE